MTEELYREMYEAPLSEADGCEAVSAACENGMNEDQAKTLSARAYVDAEFRALLLRDPAKAAAQLGIMLSDRQRDEISRHASAIRKHGRQADAILAQPGAKMVIPILILK